MADPGLVSTGTVTVPAGRVSTTRHRRLRQHDHVDRWDHAQQGVCHRAVMAVAVAPLQRLEGALADVVADLDRPAGLFRPAGDEIAGRLQRGIQGGEHADAGARGDGAVGHLLVDAEERHGAQRPGGVHRRPDRRAGDENGIGAGIDGRPDMAGDPAHGRLGQAAAADGVPQQALVDDVERLPPRHVGAGEVGEGRHEAGHGVHEGELLRHGGDDLGGGAGGKIQPISPRRDRARGGRARSGRRAPCPHRSPASRASGRTAGRAWL